MPHSAAEESMRRGAGKMNLIVELVEKVAKDKPDGDVVQLSMKVAIRRRSRMKIRINK